MAQLRQRTNYLIEESIVIEMCEMLGGEYRHDYDGDGALAGGLPAARLVLLLDVGDAQNGLREAHQVQHGGDGT